MIIRLALYIICFIISLSLFVQGGQDYIFIVGVTASTVLLSIYNMLVMYKGRLSFSTVLLIYTILTQFGLLLPFAFFGQGVVGNYSDWTLAFLTSYYLGQGILMGDIAIISYDVARLIYMLQNKRIFDGTNSNLQLTNTDTIGKLSSFLIGIVLLYFIFHILFGSMRLFGTYDDYMNSSAYNSPLYQYILIIFYAGTLYLSVTGKIKKRILGWGLWFMVVVIFAINGNKGEFLYSLLAVFGLKGVLGQKISRNMVIGGLAILFIIIPSITALRGDGISKNIGQISGSAFGAFSEMGMQLRTSVYTLENLANGTFQPLYGQSYWQPVINIFTPFMEHNIATEKVRSEFPGFGYNQVAEGYLNFGVMGIVLFFSVVGWLLVKYENKCKTLLGLAFCGTVTCVLINATRNYFVFVPGQIVMMGAIYLWFRYTIKQARHTKSYKADLKRIKQ